jgi:catechol 2,3-dioxygenase-like lactoylglutathione lyase family enzyme
MLAHVTLGANDLNRTYKLYTQFLEWVGASGSG